MPARPRRSCLAVPASSAAMVPKAATLAADEVVVDLEVRVAVAHQEADRPNLAGASAHGTLLTTGAGAAEYALALITVAARAYGIQAIDGPYAALHDDAALRASADRALALGYDGKWVIHPDQVATVNEAFTTSAAALERARGILAAADGASALDGEMVDAATKRLAESVLARASAL